MSTGCGRILNQETEAEADTPEQVLVEDEIKAAGAAQACDILKPCCWAAFRHHEVTVTTILLRIAMILAAVFVLPTGGQVGGSSIGLRP